MLIKLSGYYIRFMLEGIYANKKLVSCIVRLDQSLIGNESIMEFLIVGASALRVSRLISE